MFRALRWLASSARNRRRLLAGVVAGAVAVVAIAELLLENRHLPWRPLAIDDRGGFATGIKLRFYKLAPDRWCSELLADSAHLNVSSLEPFSEAGGCGWSDGFDVIASSDIDVAGGSVTPMRCPLAAGAHIWLTSVDRRAKAIFGVGLSEVRHFGTYSCRRMYNRASGPMSQHAYANAWDVSGFELADGRVVSVLRHWDSGGLEERFLKAARSEACAIFGVVLSPDYNEAHRDHLHLDMGNGVRCK